MQQGRKRPHSRERPDNTGIKSGVDALSLTGTKRQPQMQSRQLTLLCSCMDRRTEDTAVDVNKSALIVIIVCSSAMLSTALLPRIIYAEESANNQLSTGTPASLQEPQAHSSSPYRATTLTTHAKSRYETLWGVDSLDVKTVESGQMVRFSYLVLDPIMAAQLNDKKASPSLIDEQAHVSLEVPVVDKVGQLRQTSTPEAGRSYWMVFSNKGGHVKRGDRVSVVIGRFRADGLLVR
jgi:hypothetical protein